MRYLLSLAVLLPACTVGDPSSSDPQIASASIIASAAVTIAVLYLILR